MIDLYVCSGSAQKGDDHGTAAHYVFRGSRLDALEATIDWMRLMYPLDKGWTNHLIAVQRVPLDEILYALDLKRRDSNAEDKPE
jgi:hypothetical protein